MSTRTRVKGQQWFDSPREVLSTRTVEDGEALARVIDADHARWREMLAEGALRQWFAGEERNDDAVYYVRPERHARRSTRRASLPRHRARRLPDDPARAAWLDYWETTRRGDPGADTIAPVPETEDFFMASRADGACWVSAPCWSDEHRVVQDLVNGGAVRDVVLTRLKHAAKLRAWGDADGHMWLLEKVRGHQEMAGSVLP